MRSGWPRIRRALADAVELFSSFPDVSHSAVSLVSAGSGNVPAPFLGSINPSLGTSMVEAEHRDILKLTLASASLIWYAFLWSLGVLGCIAAYVISIY